MQLTNEDLGQILLKQSYLSEEELKDVLKEASERNIDLKIVLFERKLLTSELLENALSEYSQLPYYDVIGKPPTREIVSMLPEDFARTYSTVVVEKKDG